MYHRSTSMNKEFQRNILHVSGYISPLLSFAKNLNSRSRSPPTSVKLKLLTVLCLML